MPPTHRTLPCPRCGAPTPLVGPHPRCPFCLSAVPLSPEVAARIEETTVARDLDALHTRVQRARRRHLTSRALMIGAGLVVALGGGASLAVLAALLIQQVGPRTIGLAGALGITYAGLVLLYMAHRLTLAPASIRLAARAPLAHVDGRLGTSCPQCGGPLELPRRGVLGRCMRCDAEALLPANLVPAPSLAELGRVMSARADRGGGPIASPASRGNAAGGCVFMLVGALLCGLWLWVGPPASSLRGALPLTLLGVAFGGAGAYSWWRALRDG